jgi:hypothetical protein
LAGTTVTRSPRPTPARAARIGVGILSLVALMTASSLGSAAGLQAQGSDACSLVAREELEAALGYPLVAALPAPPTPGLSLCGYPAVDRAANADLAVLIANRVDRSTKKYFTRKSLARQYGITDPVRGLGAKAHFAVKTGPNGATQAVLGLLDGKQGVQIALSGPVESEVARDQTRAIAALILGQPAGTVPT